MKKLIANSALWQPIRRMGKSQAAFTLAFGVMFFGAPILASI